MKSSSKKLGLFVAIAAIFFLAGCSHKGALTKCPDMGAKHARPVFAKAHHHTKQKSSKPETVKNEETASGGKRQHDLVGFIAGRTPIHIELPVSFTQKMEQIEFEQANALFRANSNNKVKLQRTATNEVVFHADSRKDLRKAVSQIAFKRPAGAMSETARDVLALVGGILGIVSAATSPIPFVNFLSIFVGAAAIVLGVLGWNSERRRVWSRLGLILGIVGVSLAILFIILYFLVFNIFFF